MRRFFRKRHSVVRDVTLDADHPQVESFEYYDAAVKAMKIKDTEAYKTLHMSFVAKFYDRQSRVDLIRTAPKQIQEQYLWSFGFWHEYNEIEAFMKLAEATKYSSELFSINRKIEPTLTGYVDFCFLRDIDFNDSNLTASNARLIRDSSKLLKKIYCSEFTSVETLEEKTNNPLYFHSFENLVEDRSRSLRSKNSSYKYNEVLRSCFFILVEAYGVRTIEDIFARYTDIDQIPTLDEIIYLASKWDDLSDYLLEWSLEAYRL